MILDGHFGTKFLRWPYGSRMVIPGLPHIAHAVPNGCHKGVVRFLYRTAKIAQYSYDPVMVPLRFFCLSDVVT